LKISDVGLSLGTVTQGLELKALDVVALIHD